jgi:cell division protein FtsB
VSPVTATARTSARTAPAPRRAPARKAPARPNLRVVTPVPSRAPRAPFVLFSMLVVGLGLVGLLVLNTVVAQDAFTLHDLGTSGSALDEREQRLDQEVAALEAPAALAARARALGMVQAGDPVFLGAHGKVLGNPVPATAPPPPPPPAPSASASPKAAASAKPSHPAAKPSHPAAKPVPSAKPTP